MIRETYNLTLENYDGEQIELKLRINLLGVKNLQNKYIKNKTDVLADVVMNSITDPTVMADIFKEALNYKGNENTIHSGEELYDLLVDNKYRGSFEFIKIMGGISVVSGILSEDEFNMALNELEKAKRDMENGDISKYVESGELTKN